ncbi:13386_t:CDS:1, partial [Cetraspora pellucida]
MSTLVKENKQQEHLTMTARLKLLTRQYGASAISVYFIISTIDLGLTFILIQSGGSERVKMIENWFTETFGAWIVLKKKKFQRKEDDSKTTVIKENSREEYIHDQPKDNGTRHSPSWASTFVIAYGIHKILFPLRLGLTAAITPPLVRKLRKMGWNIGRSNKIQ